MSCGGLLWGSISRSAAVAGSCYLVVGGTLFSVPRYAVSATEAATSRSRTASRFVDHRIRESTPRGSRCVTIIDAYDSAGSTHQCGQTTTTVLVLEVRLMATAARPAPWLPYTDVVPVPDSYAGKRHLEQEFRCQRVLQATMAELDAIAGPKLQCSHPDVIGKAATIVRAAFHCVATAPGRGTEDMDCQAQWERAVKLLLQQHLEREATAKRGKPLNTAQGLLGALLLSHLPSGALRDTNSPSSIARSVHHVLGSIALDAAFLLGRDCILLAHDNAGAGPVVMRGLRKALELYVDRPSGAIELGDLDIEVVRRVSLVLIVHTASNDTVEAQLVTAQRALEAALPKASWSAGNDSKNFENRVLEVAKAMPALRSTVMQTVGIQLCSRVQQLLSFVSWMDSGASPLLLERLEALLLRHSQPPTGTEMTAWMQAIKDRPGLQRVLGHWVQLNLSSMSAPWAEHGATAALAVIDKGGANVAFPEMLQLLATSTNKMLRDKFAGCLHQHVGALGDGIAATAEVGCGSACGTHTNDAILTPKTRCSHNMCAMLTGCCCLCSMDTMLRTRSSAALPQGSRQNGGGKGGQLCQCSCRQVRAG